MSKLKNIVYSQYASSSRQKALKEFQDQYEPKKGDRFNQGGITYEVSAITVADTGLEFEISSKIPKEQLGENMNHEDYFKAVKKLAVNKKKSPAYIGIDDIVHRVGDREVKKRDYIRLKYCFEYHELFDERAVVAEVRDIQAGKSDTVIPEIAGVQSLCGRLAVTYLADSVYEKVKQYTQLLVEANEKVRAGLK